MLSSHRKAHVRIWAALAIILPLVLAMAAVLRPVPHEKDPVSLAPKPGETGK